MNTIINRVEGCPRMAFFVKNPEGFGMNGF